MAYSSNPGGDESMYADTADSPDKSSPDKSGDEGGASATLPKSLMAGKQFNVGDEIVLKIDAIYDDSFVVSYATEKGDEGGGDKGGEYAGPKPEESDMAGMMQ